MKFIRAHRLAVIASVLTVAALACGASIASASGGSTTATGSTTGATATGQSGLGTITVTVTGPNGRTRTRPTRAIRCTLENGDYILSRERLRDGRLGRAALIVAGYHGAGTYTGTLRVSVRGLFVQLRSERLNVPVTMTDSGGSVTITRTLPGIIHPKLRGKTVSVDASWSCTP